MPYSYPFGNSGHFPFNPKVRNFRLVRQMERSISVWSDQNIQDQLRKWSTLTGLVFSVGRTEMSLSIWQNCFPQCRSFFVLLTRTITKWNLPFHWVRGISEISNRNFCWVESARGNLENYTLDTLEHLPVTPFIFLEYSLFIFIFLDPDLIQGLDPSLLKSSYISGKMATYPSPKPTFCPKWKASIFSECFFL